MTFSATLGTAPGRLSSATGCPRFLKGAANTGARVIQAGVPILEYDVGLLARRRNALNLGTTVTVCAGIFSRGTYGAVRVLTDPNLRMRNEQVLTEEFDALDNFWTLFFVPAFRSTEGRLETVTPDLARPFHRLQSQHWD
jgi:hypothetical protein